MTAFIALGLNQRTLIAALFLALTGVLVVLTLVAACLGGTSRIFHGMMEHMTYRWGPGVRLPEQARSWARVIRYYYA